MRGEGGSKRGEEGTKEYARPKMQRILNKYESCHNESLSPHFGHTECVEYFKDSLGKAIEDVLHIKGFSCIS